MAPDPQEPRRNRADIPGAAEYMGLGIQFVVVLLMFLFAGKWLDGKLGTSPWLLILGVFLGFILSFFSVYYRLNDGKRKPRDGER